MHDLVSPVQHHGHLSDHDAAVFVLKSRPLPSKHMYQSHYWKLNKAVLSEPNFKINFTDIVNDTFSEKIRFDSISDWFDSCFKPSIHDF